MISSRTKHFAISGLIVAGLFCGYEAAETAAVAVAVFLVSIGLIGMAFYVANVRGMSPDQAQRALSANKGFVGHVINALVVLAMFASNHYWIAGFEMLLVALSLVGKWILYVRSRKGIA